MEEQTKTTKRKKTPAKKQEVVIVGQESKREVNKKFPARNMPKMSFDAWWMRTRTKHKFNPEMKEVIWKHFKARGFLKSGRFDDGLRDFGVKS